MSSFRMDSISDYRLSKYEEYQLFGNNKHRFTFHLLHA